ncbi:dehydrogenase E1 and transketolase domain-containing protein 1 [Chytriomyces sp. MP71]|nr:dehydrogenase E1 and transketolase domain-containing protein 1 [Chytriomyces sp. MP71]
MLAATFRRHTSAPPRSTSALRGVSAFSRPYHYTSNQVYGFREPVTRTLPDYTAEQLANRASASNLLRFVTYYRSLGHRLASLDPLSLTPADPSALYQLDPARYGLSPGDTFDVNGILNTPVQGPHRLSLEEIVQRLNRTYAGSVGFEFAHLPNVSERRWCNELVETMYADRRVDQDSKKRMMYLLSRSEVFDHFMAKRFPQVKRYGLEGAESMMIVMDELFRASSAANVRDVVIGMPHRGRLNLLTDLLKYSPVTLFNKIKGNSEFPEDVPGAGDVLSHVSQSVDLEYSGAQNAVHVSLLHNPSHLEAINPVATGKARAKQFDLLEQMTKSSTASPECDIGDKVLCVQLHGDSAFAGQGVVMETLAMSNLPHYTCGGSIHVIVNNQIGYTTQAQNARSTIYSSDVGKIIDAPVIHVNADFPEDVAVATKIAFEYRNKFRKDVIIDLIAYRRMGHNELDEPAFTQPVMYKHIRGRRSVPKLFEQKLLDEGITSQQEIDEIRESYTTFLDKQLEESYSHKPEADTLKGKWSEMTISKADVTKIDTGVDVETLKKVGIASVASHGVSPHGRLAKFHITPRLSKLESGTGLDWATCEALAFGSLLLDNYHVRISGQDVGRGTFSQRHAMLVDQNDEHTVIPLNHITPSQRGKLEIANSNLSEFAVLGFEVGVSWENPQRLCIWEAQFGDFFNGAQIIIDTFISSSESKWLRQTALVMLLPHGYDGAGPEHSSCRIERFLQLTDSKFEYNDPTPDNCNMHVAYPTTPAQMFHLLRRQMVRNYRRPLIIAGPKTLLRHPACLSNLSEMGPGTTFQPVLSDAASESAKRVVFLSGKLFYDLVKERDAKGLTDSVALVRLEEIAPFPWEDMKQTLAGFPNAKEFLWVQEEPQNQGSYTFVAPRLEQLLPEGAKLRFVGRKALAVPATGISARYKTEQAAVIAGAFS